MVSEKKAAPGKPGRPERELMANPLKRPALPPWSGEKAAVLRLIDSLELETHPKLRGKSRAAGRDFVVHTIGYAVIYVSLLRNCRQRRTDGLNRNVRVCEHTAR